MRTQVDELLKHREADLGKPVITATQLMLWHCLQSAKIDATKVPRGQPPFATWSGLADFWRRRVAAVMVIPAEPHHVVSPRTNSTGRDIVRVSKWPFSSLRIMWLAPNIPI